MLSLRNLRGGAIVAAAFTLAACGSDGVSAPQQPDNSQIIADLSAALGQTDSVDQPVRYEGLQLAIGALTAGAPVTSGNVVIDGDTLTFDFTAVTMAYDAGSGPVYQQSFVVGWNAGADSIVALAYTKGEMLPLMQRPEFGSALLAGHGSSLAGGTAVAVSGGNGTVATMPASFIDLQTISFSTVDSEWSTVPYSVRSGSIVFGSSNGECDDVDPSEFGIPTTLLSCTKVNLTVDGSGQLFLNDESMDEGPAIELPGQLFGGVRGVFEAIG
jgi:hypothetical protein